MTAPDTPMSPSKAQSHDQVAVLILIVLTLVSMGRICTHDFSWWDDPMTVHQNPWLRPPTLATLIHYWTTSEAGLYIPVTYTVWAAIALIARVPMDQNGIALNPWLFHTTSVFCHLLSVLVAYRIIRLLDIDSFAAACGALVFAIHPVQVEAVAWASGLKDVLSGLFALVALWQYALFSLSDLRGRASALRYGLATTAFFLALLAKPSAMALPLAAMAIDHWALGRDWRRIWPGIMGWLVIATPIAIIARQAQYGGNTPMPLVWLRPLIVFDSLAFYLWKLVLPLHLIVDYGRNTTTVFRHGWCYWDWIFPLGVTLFLILGRPRRPLLLAAGAIFLTGCLPVLGFTPAMFQANSTTTDHYLYLSMFGPGLALAWLLSNHPPAAIRLASCAILIALIGLTLHQAGYWRNDLTLFSHDVEVNPTSYVGYMNLGGTYKRNGELSNSIGAFEKATRSDPENPSAWGDLADALSSAGRADDAITAARRSIDIQIHNPNLRPNWPQDNALLGELLFDEHRFGEAIPYMQTAAALEPENEQMADELIEARRHAATQPSGR